MTCLPAPLPVSAPAVTIALLFIIQFIAAENALLPAQERLSPFHFIDATAQSGIRFQHFNGLSGKRFMVETMGSGVCIFDYDGDGREDLYFIQGAGTPGSRSRSLPPGNALYRNLGKGRFEDVTAASGLGDTGQGQGCAAADMDGDADQDMFVVNFGANVLYRNNGDGTFTDVTAKAGVGDTRWGSSAAWADVDGDHDLDLYLVNYVDFTYENHKFCGDRSRNLQYYCSPKAYNAQSDVLYINDGSGVFKDNTRTAGVFNDREGKGLGVTFLDAEGDGDPDIYVANDSTRNFLYRNDGSGRFKDVSMLAGVGYSESGVPQAGMGVSAGDINNDLAMDLIVTNLSNETNQLYRNLGNGIFLDVTFRSGVGAPGLLQVGFGVAWGDLDNDSDLDLALANGHILDNVQVLSDVMTYAQANHLYENLGEGRFREVGRHSGPGLVPVEVSRGLAIADLDGDGALDIVVTNNGGRAVLLFNRSQPRGNAVRLRLESDSGNRHAVGARVQLLAGDMKLLREVTAGTSYQSQSELTVHLGVGGRTQVKGVEVHWPAEFKEYFSISEVNKVLTLKKGTGAKLVAGN